MREGVKLLDINDLRRLCRDETIAMKQHSKKRFVERGITVDDIHNAVHSGEIIEQYENDKPFPACLVSGLTENKPIHVVVSIGDEYLHIITAYFPDDRWESDLKTRKGQ
jgi:uncharacterized protein (UPF0303 family)